MNTFKSRFPCRHLQMFNEFLLLCHAVLPQSLYIELQSSVSGYACTCSIYAMQCQRLCLYLAIQASNTTFLIKNLLALYTCICKLTHHWVHLVPFFSLSTLIQLGGVLQLKLSVCAYSICLLTVLPISIYIYIYLSFSTDLPLTLTLHT